MVSVGLHMVLWVILGGERMNSQYSINRISNGYVLIYPETGGSGLVMTPRYFKEFIDLLDFVKIHEMQFTEKEKE